MMLKLRERQGRRRGNFNAPTTATMHLLSEKKVIYSVLVVTAVFFVALAALTLWSSSDRPRDSQLKALYVP